MAQYTTSRKGLLLGVVIAFGLMLWLGSGSNGERGLMVVFVSGLIGVWIIAQKGYFSTTAIILFLIFGWWAGLILLGLGGPLLLLVAALLPSRQRCPHCREWINQKAIKCPHCQSSVVKK